MRLAPVVQITGTLVRLFSPALLAPAAVAALYREWNDVIGFFVAFVCTAGAGVAMRTAGGRDAAEMERLRRVEGIAVVAATWFILALLSAVPYVWTGLGIVDAVFESMSGLTTTGATVFTDFSRFGRGVFFWRSLTQWLGGVGVIALFIAVLPRLAIGGRELFFAEAPGPTDEKLTPQLRQTALALWQLYATITAFEVA
jgi:trk system potassium uptake protein